MLEKITHNIENTDLEVQPSFDFLLEEETRQQSLVAEHRSWLKTIRRERPSPNTPFKVGVYIRFFNQTKYDNYLEYQKQNFLSTIAQYPKWEFIDFYIDYGSTAPNMESAKAWCDLISDCENGKIDLVITQKVSNVTRRVNDIILLSRLFASREHPIGFYFVSEDLFTLASYYMEDLNDEYFFPDADWEKLPDEISEIKLLNN